MSSTFVDVSGTNNPIVFYTGDTLPQMDFQLVANDGTGPFDLSGANVTITIAPDGTSGPGFYGQSVQVIDPYNGIVAFQLPAPFTLPPGVNEALYRGQITVDYGSGSIQSFDPFPIVIVRRIGPNG